MNGFNLVPVVYEKPEEAQNLGDVGSTILVDDPPPLVLRPKCVDPLYSQRGWFLLD